MEKNVEEESMNKVPSEPMMANPEEEAADGDTAAPKARVGFLSVCMKAGSGKGKGIKEDREILAQKMLRELTIYLIFIIIVCLIAFGTSSKYSYYYTKVMMDLFLDGDTFKEITSVEAFWEYAMGPLMTGLYWKKWYNDEPLGKIYGYVYYENKIIGLPRMRQVRVKSDSCDVVEEFQTFIDSCFGGYSLETEDKAIFGEGLVVKNNTAWVHNTSSEIEGFWHWGEITSYDGGGYTFEFGVDETKTREALQHLYESLWIRRGTRAVFITFTVYNANINLFCIVILTVEFPATGGAFPSWSFNTLKLIHYENKWENFMFVCKIFFCIFVVFYIIEESVEILFKGRQYLSEMWNLLDLFLVVSASVCICFHAYKEFVVIPLLPARLKDFTKYQDFVSIAFWESRSNNAIAITVFLSWVKVFKYISFNKTMTQLATTLSRCAKDLMGFFIMFFIVFLAFTQLGYLLFGSQVEDFSTFMNSFFTLFRLILGDFDFYQLEKANRILGPIYFMLFVFFVFFVLINMFLAIINDTYSEVKSDMTNQTDMNIMSDYLKQGYNRLLSRLWRSRANIDFEKELKKYTSKDKILASEWKESLVDKGFDEDLLGSVFNKFGVEPEHIVKPAEQKKIITELQLKATIEKTDAKEEEILDKEGKATENVPAEEFAVVTRRVDRMEAALVSLVANMERVLNKANLLTDSDNN